MKSKKRIEGKDPSVFLDMVNFPKSITATSMDRMCFYAQELLELGLTDMQILCMFSDIYWDSHKDTKRELAKQK